MTQHRICVLLLSIIVIFSGAFGVAAQDPAPTEAPVYDPACTSTFMEAYMSGWESEHRQNGQIDLVAAAQVARAVYKAFDAAKVPCDDILGNLEEYLLRSLRGDYVPEDLARMLQFVNEAVGSVEYNDCAYQVASRFVQQVDWGDTNPIQAGRTISDIFRTVREVVPNGECNPTFQIIEELLSHMDSVPSDPALIRTLYQIIGEATNGQYVSDSSCAYTLANTFLQKVEWDGLDTAAIEQLVKNTFTISYTIGGTVACESDAALAITAMLLDDSYRFAPDASVIQQAYDAASGQAVPTPEPTVIIG